MTDRLGALGSIQGRLITAAAVIVILVFVRFASSVIAPMLLAAFIASIATPSLRWMRAKGVPKYLALALVVFVIFDIGSIMMLVMTGAVEALQDRIPTYQERLAILAAQFSSWLNGLGVDYPPTAMPEIIDMRSLGRFATIALASTGQILATGSLVLLAVIFILLEVPSLTLRARQAFGLEHAGEERFRRLFVAINKYIMLKSLMSLATALLVYLWLHVMGIDFAVFLTLFAFFANFVPFVGAVVMTVPGVALALLQDGPATALVVAMGYVFANVAIGSFVEPRVMGRGLGVSTLAVFLSLVFWGWLLGTIGVFLSVPLTMALIMALESSPVTSKVALLLKSGDELVQPAAKLSSDTGGGTL